MGNRKYLGMNLLGTTHKTAQLLSTLFTLSSQVLAGCDFTGGRGVFVEADCVLFRQFEIWHLLEF